MLASPPTVRRAALRHALAMVAAGVVPVSGAHAAERYEGRAQARGGGPVLYSETHWLYPQDGRTARLVLYRCADGTPFARKRVSDAASVAPDFEFVDGRDGYREGVRTAGGRRLVFWQPRASAPAREKPLPPHAQAVIDAGFDAFVRKRWNALDAGTASAGFLIPSRFDYLGVKVRDAGASRVDGQPARKLTMRLDAWFGFALPEIALVYGEAGRRLLRYEGIGTIRDAKGRNQNVSIEFPASLRTATVPAAQVSEADGAKLAAQCPGAAM